MKVLSVENISKSFRVAHAEMLAVVEHREFFRPWRTYQKTYYRDWPGIDTKYREVETGEVASREVHHAISRFIRDESETNVRESVIRKFKQLDR